MVNYNCFQFSNQIETNAIHTADANTNVDSRA